MTATSQRKRDPHADGAAAYARGEDCDFEVHSEYDFAFMMGWYNAAFAAQAARDEQGKKVDKSDADDK